MFWDRMFCFMIAVSAACGASQTHQNIAGSYALGYIALHQKDLFVMQSSTIEKIWFVKY